MTEHPSPVDEATASEWAAANGLSFPPRQHGDATPWIWYEGGDGRYSGYLPENWEDTEGSAYCDSIVSDQFEFYGLYERMYDFGVCTVVTQGRGGDYEVRFAIPRVLSDHEITAWQDADRFFEREFDEIRSWSGRVFSDFVDFEESDLELSVDRLVASIGGWANQGPYSEWAVGLYDIGDRGFVVVAGPGHGGWEIVKVFPDLESVRLVMYNAGLEVGGVVEVEPAWTDRYPKPPGIK